MVLETANARHQEVPPIVHRLHPLPIWKTLLRDMRAVDSHFTHSYTTPVEGLGPRIFETFTTSLFGPIRVLSTHGLPRSNRCARAQGAVKVDYLQLPCYNRCI